MASVALIQHPFDASRIVSGGRVFSDSVEQDPWTMFHGTSGFNAAAIERDGFVPTDTGVSYETVNTLVAIFERMKWGGNDPGGLAILKPFSRDYDLKSARISPVFFADRSRVALRYASRDFAGGEKLRSLRRALADLNQYRADTNVRERHVEMMDREYRELTRLDAHPSMLEAKRPVQVDLGWLSAQLEGVAEIETLAEGALERHQFGVAYAVKL